MAAISSVGLIRGFLILLSCTYTGWAELNLPLQSIDHWAQNFGDTIYSVASKATGLTDLQTDYLLMKPRVVPINGQRMVQKMKEDMQKMLQKKVEAIKKLVNVAEEAYAQHDTDKRLAKDYPKAKKLNVSEFLLVENEHFNYIPVNLTMSTVHVPTNVYDESVEVLNGVAWSEALDPHFRENYENDPTLTWQYFGSATGFFRNYPGSTWRTETYENEGVDIYDCRTRGWYIQAATSPKDIIMLLDTSGSMTGQRMEIAKATVEKILDTLSDDDFFNIIKFSERPEYVDECFNRTLVQANADNKKRLKESIQNVATKDIAQFDLALMEAFELFSDMNDTDKGTMCNRAIMLITDGAPENYEDIFARYNWPNKNVRVFTYLIGREVSDDKQVKWMACANKGYYSHISTLADVQEKVQEYIHVLSRPMVIQRADHTIWTGVYIDAAGLKLMTSVAAPVFDRRNKTTYEGILLGVMGTDVPLKELIKLTPQYKLGVNGYAFAITNNGYILFHPDFRPTQGDMEKPNYNSVDLAEVELADDEPGEDGVPMPNYDFELRRQMVNRIDGKMKMKVKRHYDNMKRVAIRENNYFFTDIEDTPFSLGIALPSGYGMNYLDGSRSLNSDIKLDAFQASLVKIAEWNYCKMDTNETRQDMVEMLLKYLELGQQGSPLYDSKCDDELIRSLLFDVAATRGALASWMKENRDGTLNDSTSRRNGIELVFIGTKSGLTRYLPLVENLTDPSFIETNKNSIEEMYYKRAVEGGESVFTFSVPFNAGENFDWNMTVVTASSPIIISEEGRETVAAVVGMQMRYDKFYEFFMNTTQQCHHGHGGEKGSPGSCNFTCESTAVDCYLLDNNGFVVLSENHGEIGKFFGELDGTLMKELIQRDQPVRKGVFKRIQMYDYQGICEIWVKGVSGASSMFIDPIRNLLSSVSWMVQEVALFLVQFNLWSWWRGDYTVRGNEDELAGIDDTETLLGKIFAKLENFGTETQVLDWRNELFAGTTDYTNRDEVLDWYQSIKKQYSPRLEGYESCIEELPLFLGIPEALPQFATLNICGWCTRSYSIHRVYKTNLMLLAVDAQCHCIMDPPIQVVPTKIEYNDTMMCQRLQTDIYRKRPASCYAFHPQEDSTHCGRGVMIEPSIACMCSLLLLTLYTLVTH